MNTPPTLNSYQEDKTIFDRTISHIKENESWYPHGLKVHPLFLIIQGIASAHGVKKVNGDGYTTCVIKFVDNYLEWAYDHRDFERLIPFFKSKSEHDTEWIEQYEKKFQAATRKFVAIADRCALTEPPQSIADVVSSIEELINAHLAPQSYGYLTEAFEGDWIGKYLADLAPEISEQERAILLQPSYKSFLRSFENDLYDATEQAEIEELLRAYYWIQVSYWRVPKLTEETVKKMKESVSYEKFSPPHKSQILSRLRNKKQVENFVHLSDRLVAIQDTRKMNMMRMNFALMKLIQKAADLIPGWGVTDLLSLTPLELISLLHGKGDPRLKQNIVERNKKSAWIFTDTAYCLYTEQHKVHEIFSLFLPPAKDFVTGYPASPGIVRGVARIVFSEDDFSKFKKGDVLVTSMTRPEFLPLLRDAAAFVTNEGGITCHAAVVSRELQKPCVIGTKIGTKMFKDGDMVEVNADKGTVRQIS